MRALAALPLLACLLCAAPALAHKVNVFAVAENGALVGEAYFSGGGKALDSLIEVFDASGAVVAQGRTGADGAFRIPLPATFTPPLRVVLRAGEGHQNDYTLTAQDLGQDLGLPAQAARAPSSPASPVAQAAPAGTIDETRLAALVEQAVAKAVPAIVEEKLAPLRLQLTRMAEQDQSARMRDIIGGLGWIIGLVGIAAWFKRPKK
ncbi:cobalamin biosynthesis protein CbiL [Fundidesulfovibrio soli]|uniref:cobalamin biosynthesis protein CbiL n=1 Tax=Fundidesulfovibrio soli TaxID=2922716 RepID=UPI001FAF7580|nr:cobalamin biosynthesis protein CbiL [Fundidesulfovibrio soli]